MCLYLMVRLDWKGFDLDAMRTFSYDIVSPDHRQTHEKGFYHEETGLENVTRAWYGWCGEGEPVRVTMLNFNLFRVKIRTFFLKIEHGLKILIFVLFHFNSI